MVAHNDKPVLYLPSAADWEVWLGENWQSSSGIRLQLAKKASTLPGMSYDQALEVALCYGWIDGQVSALDTNFFLQSFTPRRPRSSWSQRNTAIVERLIAEGRMRPAGLSQVEAAKADGRWDSAYNQNSAAVPDDLKAALEANPAAAAFFLTLSSQNRFAILFRIGQVKSAAARAAKVAGFVSMLERGETIHPQGQGR